MSDHAGLRRGFDECRRVARGAGRNFWWTFLVLPADQRRDMAALYAFLRRTDDLGDGTGPVAERRAALAKWREDAARAVRGDAAGLPEWWSAFADVAVRRRFAPEVVDAVVRGVTSDLDQVPPADFAATERYCWHVASTVGLLCLRVWGADDPRATGPAERCGVAFQLTNILRDVAEDQALGRVYLPRDELLAAGLPPDRPLDGPRDALESFLRGQIARAAGIYEEARELDRYLPGPGRACWRAMTDIYGGVLRRLAREPLAVTRRRVSLPAPRKLWAAARAWPWRFLPGPAARP